METRANHLWVGAVTLVLLAALAAFIIWIARLGQGQQDEFDIFYGQAVSRPRQWQPGAVRRGAGRAGDRDRTGQRQPEFVRVRIKVKDDVPMLVGTQATIEASFTGVSTILLDGARKDAPPITCETTACPEGRPVIPPGRGGFRAAIVANTPLLLERLATLTEQLNTILGPENQDEISGILRNTNRLTGGLADATPELTTTLKEFRTTMTEFNQTLDAVEKLTLSTDKLVQDEGAPVLKELAGTLRNQPMPPLLRWRRRWRTPAPPRGNCAPQRCPNAEATLEDLRAGSRSLRAFTEKLESEGAGALVGGKTLPDYKP